MDDNLKAAEAKIEEIKKAHNVKIGFTITFPVYNILPEEVVLAMKILKNHKMKISMTLEPIEPKPPLAN